MPIDLMLTAFVMGLFGSAHCVGMCGGIIGSLSMSLSTQISPKPAALIWYLLNYNIGRIVSYVIAGIIVGLLASFSIQLLPDPHQYSMKISGIFLIALGLYIAQLWMGLSKIEQLAAPFWNKIQPLAQRFLPPKTPIRALPLGMIWGCLPCGLVYSVLPIAYSANSLQNSAWVMLSFGLATLPMLMFLGNSAQIIKTKMQNKTFRLILGGLLILWGTAQIFGFNPFMDSNSHSIGHSIDHSIGH